MAQVFGYWEDAPVGSDWAVLVRSPNGHHVRVETTFENNEGSSIGLPYDLLELSWMREEDGARLVDWLNELFGQGKISRRFLNMAATDFQAEARARGFHPRPIHSNYLNPELLAMS